MSRKEYPRVVRGQMGYQGRKTCVRCLEHTKHWISIQFSWFRGDDETMKLCKKCQHAMTDEEIVVLHQKTYPDR